MNISKHGVITKEEAKTEKFKCEQCGCEFDADYDEYYVNKGSQSLFSSVTTYTYSANVTDVYVCSCPECHKIVTKTKTRAIEVPVTITYTDACTNKTHT